MIKKFKILHTPFNEANNAFGLSFEEKRQGFFSRLIVFRSDGYFDSADKTLFTNNVFLNEIRRWIFIFYMLFEYDIIHYNFGSCVAPHRVAEYGRMKWSRWVYNNLYARYLDGLDLVIAHKLRKKIFVTFQGSDGRIIGYCKENYEYHFSKEDGFYDAENFDIYRKNKINMFSKYADKIYALNPDLLNTMPSKARFVPYASVRVMSIAPNFPKKIIQKIHIVHAPSNQQIKGTKYVISSINHLKNEGFNFDFTLVEGLRNYEALEIYRKADVVIDQLLAGWYGAFAVEAMAMGKPVVAYIRNKDLVHIPFEMYADLPIINANPDNLLDVLRGIMNSDGNGLHEVGRRSRDYVCKWHDPAKITRDLMADYISSYA
jgi:glycosyltransferase involved in cell wall biosynthesis